MKKFLLNVLSLVTVAYTIYYMSLNEITTNEGALSKTGLKHPILFAVWGILTYISLYFGIFAVSNRFKVTKNIHYVLALAALAGMAMTLIFKFDYSLRVQYLLHCAGSLIFSVCTGICVFITYLYNFKKSLFFSVFTVLIGLILVTDLIFLLIFKQNALIEALPVIFALVLIPITLYIPVKKEKEYADAAR